MDYTRERVSVNRPPVLDDTNYDYWKAKMYAFLKYIDIKTWKVVIKGWKHPVITSEDATTSLKPEAEWIDAEDNEALRNSKAFNFIFNGVDKNMFRLIKICTKFRYT